jgi:uncharacterized protein (DUF2249 family)
MTINANTKIAALLKQNPGALEAIISISAKFAKLRNPILRKVMAGRTSIEMASRLGGCTVDDFLIKLQPLGFEIDKKTIAVDKNEEKKPVPEFLKSIKPDKIVALDVRSVIESGKDPLNIIMQKVKALETGYVLNVINSFEPTPLMYLLGKQGFESYTEIIRDELVHTYFYRKSDKPLVIDDQKNANSEGWDDILRRFNGKLETVDVKELPMPLPMHTILGALETLAEDKALFVYHKRIPVFLLPELEERNFSYRIKEIGDADVQLLIYKD